MCVFLRYLLIVLKQSPGVKYDLISFLILMCLWAYTGTLG